MAWAPDSTRLAYLSQRDAVTHVFFYDFAKHAETQLTSGRCPTRGRVSRPTARRSRSCAIAKNCAWSTWSRSRSALLASGFIGGGFGDGSWPGRPTTSGSRMPATPTNADCAMYIVVPAAGGTAAQVSFLANGNVNSLQWSPDGKFLIFETSQRTGTAASGALDLAPRQPKFARRKVRRSVQTRTTARRRAWAGRGGDATANARRAESAGESGDRFR